jgi:hypothetical protein
MSPARPHRHEHHDASGELGGRGNTPRDQHHRMQHGPPGERHQDADATASAPAASERLRRRRRRNRRVHPRLRLRVVLALRRRALRRASMRRRLLRVVVVVVLVGAVCRTRSRAAGSAARRWFVVAATSRRDAAAFMRERRRLRRRLVHGRQLSARASAADPAVDSAARLPVRQRVRSRRDLQLRRVRVIRRPISRMTRKRAPPGEFTVSLT